MKDTRTQMSSEKLAVLLWYFETDEQHPAHKDEVHSGICEELVEVDFLAEYHPARENTSDSDLVLTDKGHAYVRLLLATPLPVQRWVDPRD